MSETGAGLERILEKFGGSVSAGVPMADGTPMLTADLATVHELLLFLKTDDQLSFVMLTDLFGVDYFGREPRFEIVYLLDSMKLKSRMAVKAGVKDGEEPPTASDIWCAAEWLEREAYDMFGIRFKNHPDLRRILMVEDFDGYPPRKDFPTEGYGFNEPFKVDLQDVKVEGPAGKTDR
jgi:NADH-quinone oxidoreductase subunit C